MKTKEVINKIKLVYFLIIIILFINALGAFAADYPHFDGNSISCESCHYVSGTQTSLMPPWTIHVPTDIDDTQFNTLCRSCHNDVEAPFVRTHSSLQTDNGYGDWSIECKVCHNPHYQRQFDTYGGASYLYSGASTGITATSLTKTGAGWTTNAYQGLVVVPNITQKRYKYKILSNTGDTLTLEGPVNPTKAAAGNTFAIVYGKLINSTITTPNSGSKTVKLFNASGADSFADGDAAYDGVCEVCHTQTTYHRNTAAGDHSHNAGTACTGCHVHTKGFKVACDVCHGYPPVVNAATGGPDGLVNNPGTTGSVKAGAHNLHVTTKGYVCTICHYNSAGSGPTHNNSLTITMGYSLFGGTYQGGSYDGQAGVNYNATTTTPATTVSNTGTKTCSNIYCHSTGQSTSDGAGSTPTYANPVWDNPSSGACGTCHKVTEASGLTSGSHAAHLGTTGVNGCGDCHTGAANDASAYNSSNHVNASMNVANSYTAGGAPGNGYGTCSTASCHDDGTGDQKTTTTWGTPGAGCSECHAEIPSTGSHTKHVTTTSYDTASCGDCHDGAVQGTTPPEQHLDSNIDVYDSAAGDLGYTADKAKGSAYTTCLTAYCHSTGQSTTDGNSAAPTYATPTWGNAASAACGTCHKVTEASGLTSGSHAAHLGTTGVNGCGDCHSGAANDASSYNSSNHVNKLIDVANSYTAGGAPGNGYGTCLTALCHSNGLGTYKTTPAWTTAGTNCNTCHDAMPSSGAHSAHISSAATAYGSTSINSTSGNYDFGCGNCHPVNAANHRNGSLDITLNKNHGGALKSKNNASDDVSGYSRTQGVSVTCSAAYCHSEGNGDFVVTSPNWYGGSINGCNFCHGNATYSDYRKATPLYASGSPKGNAHIFHTSVQATPANEMQCVNCHGLTTTTNTSIADRSRHVNGTYDVAGGGDYWDFGSVGETWYGTDTTVTIGSYDQGTKKCMNVSCHPASDTAQKTWAADNYLCTDCHIVDMTSPSSYHHAMNNAGTGYPTATPQGDSLAGTNPENRTCLMCHVDHNIFSPLLNSNSTSRANVLRTGIDVVPDANDTSTFTNTDFNAATGQGICVSCHQQELILDTSRRMMEPNVTKTPVITVSDYTTASHQYVINSRYTNDGSTFNANCTKCHDTQENETNTFQGMYSGEPSNTNRFGVHVGPIRRLQANLGISAPAETEEEDLCYRCHSKSTDSNPGAGPAKAVANRDFYNATNMSAASQDVFTVMQSTGGRPAGPTSMTNKLYFKPSAAESPSEPMPNAQASGDTFQGGTWTGRSMSPWTTAVNYESYNQTLSVPTGTVNWRALSFTSPAVSTDTTVPAGNWVVSIYARESSTSANANVRYTIYKWNSNDTQGATIIARNTHVMEFSTLSAPGSLHTMTMTLGSPVVLTAGEKIVVDMEIQTVSVSTSGSRTLSIYFGNGATGSLQMPGNVTFNYNDPGLIGFGHNVSLYSGLHKPSNSDETLEYISTNKHVECVDCHNMHAAGATRHTQGTNAVSPIIKGVPGAVIQANTTSTLYLRNTTTAEPAPNATASTDTFQGGTWQARNMLSAQGSAAQSQAVTINNTGNPLYWRMTSFVSPAVTSNTNIPAGNWNLRIWAQESSTGANAYMRATIYEWNANDTKGTVIVAPTSYSSELTTTSTAYLWTLSGGAASLSTGDRIVIELEIESRGATSTSYTATYRWNGSGTTNDSYVTMPAALPLGGTSGNWTAPTYTLGSATKEYEICYKCHSGANTNVTSFGGAGAAAFTDVGLEFNPGNKSFHPIVAALNSSGSGSSVLQSYQLTGGWTAGQTMYCSDCHTTDSANSWGPHGSSVKWMLAGTNKAWPYDTAANNGTSTSTASSYRTLAERNTNLGTTNGLFCRNCHTVEVTNNQVHKEGSGSGDKHDIACVECHLRVPHGGKVSRLISATNTAAYPGNLPARYAMNGNGGRTGSLTIRKFTKTSPASYSKSNCYATGSSSNGRDCDTHNDSGNGTESW